LLSLIENLANFDTNEDKPWNYPSSLPAWNLKCPTNNQLDSPPYIPLSNLLILS
jgi:maltase-glucoamylase